MNISLLRRTLLSISVFGVILVATFVVFSHTPAATQAKTPVSLLGTWDAEIQFTSGPRAGQISQSTITFAADGTVTSLTTDGISGTGMWKMTSDLGFHYDFKEQIYTNGQNIGYVDVVEDGFLAKDGKKNSSQGNGTFYMYTPDGPRLIAVNDTRTIDEIIKVKK